ncbi:SAVED domain-containing protein [Candidatus Gracilibacteria bacterium]|nr:SAVED domain-containing protein [Candidatus Gracilibacteria bacterium]
MRRTLHESLVAYPAHFAREETAAVRAVLRRAFRGRRTRALCLNWQAAFNQFPTAETWRDELIPALNDVVAELSSRGVRAIRLYQRARISACLAFGYVFRSTSNFSLWVQQYDAWWRTRPFDRTLKAAHQQEQTHDEDGNDLTIEIAVSQGASARRRCLA